MDTRDSRACTDYENDTMSCMEKIQKGRLPGLGAGQTSAEKLLGWSPSLFFPFPLSSSSLLLTLSLFPRTLLLSSKNRAREMEKEERNENRYVILGRTRTRELIMEDALSGTGTGTPPIRGSQAHHPLQPWRMSCQPLLSPF